MIFPRTEAELEVYIMLHDITKLSSIEKSPYGPENAIRHRVIESLKEQYFATLEKMEEERKGTTEKPDNTRQALDKFPSLINIWNSRIADKSCTMEYVSNKIGRHDSIGYGFREIRFDYFGTDVQIVLERNSSGSVLYKLGESKYDLPLDMGEKLCKEFDEIFKTRGIK